MQIAIFLFGAVFLLTGLGLLWRWVWRQCEAAHQADWGGVWLNRLDGLNRLFCRRYHRFHYTPIPLPEQGAAVLASNHVSGLDPLLMIAAARRPLRFMIAQEEYRRFGLTWLFRAIGCIPVERNRQPERALREALRALQKGEVVAMFPQGGIQTGNTGPGKLKKGVVKLAQLSGAAIYPVHVQGIKAAGGTLSAVLIRSHATLTAFPSIHCPEQETADRCLAELTRIFACAEQVPLTEYKTGHN